MPISRRPNGEGSWQVLPNRTWEYRTYIRYLDATKQRKAFYGATKQQCKAKAKEAQDAAGRIAPQHNLDRVETWLEYWLSSKRRNNELKPRTADFYDDHIRNYIVPELGQFNLGELKSWHIQDWLDAHVDAGLGIPTVRGMWRTLRAALSRAKQLRVVVENEAAGDFIKLPPHSPKAAKHLEPSELSRFRDVLVAEAMSARTDAQRALAGALFLSLTTGMRNAEIIGLTWDDVNFGSVTNPATIDIRRTLQRVRDPDAAPRVHSNGQTIRPKKWVVGPPKSDAGTRRLPLFPEAVTVLRAERDRQILRDWGPVPEGDLVFRSRYGKPLTDVALANCMKRVCALAGVEDRSFYALRHTAASAAIAAGESDVSVAQFLGHSDSATTKRIYARAFQERSTDRMLKMREVMLGPATEQSRSEEPQSASGVEGPPDGAGRA